MAASISAGVCGRGSSCLPLMKRVGVEFTPSTWDARCAGPAKYFKVVDEVFRSQPRWESGNIKPVLEEIGKANGVNETQFATCLQDQAALDALSGRARRAFEADGVNSTPTLFINGKKIEPLPQSPAEMDAAIAQALKTGGR